tara:strand:- start:136 stop:471 length:336 start_codon:yes stop_codon:yes gene_type:complete
MGFTTFSRRDAQRFRKVYPRIRKTPRFFTISDEQMSIESTKISLNNEVQGEFNFQLEYNQIPTVQLSAETSSDDQGMVNVFITQLTTKFVKFETSAPFTGQIHIQIFKVGS